MIDTNESVVRTTGLCKVFKDFWLREKVTAVNELDLDIRPREVFGLLGPNGSGKSTTLKMILSLLFPTSGTIAVFGKHPSNVRVKNRIGFLPEETNLYPFLDARETLDYYGRLFRLPRSQRAKRIDMLLEMVGLTAVAYRPVGEYSKGMQRRIGLAQALINDPDLLIVDEPTSGLDPLGTRQFKDLIRTLADRGKTVILSSHLLADVEDICDRVCILYGGRKRAEGPIDELLARSDQTQLTVDDLDEATLAKLRELLAAAGRSVDVTHPRDRLEDLFLRIVEQARQQRLATGGAGSGGAVADFLAGREPSEPAHGREVIESLLADSETAEPSEPQPESSPTTHVERVDESLVEDLIKQPPSEPAEAADTAEPAESEDGEKPPADRGVIDDLLKGDDEKRRERNE